MNKISVCIVEDVTDIRQALEHAELARKQGAPSGQEKPQALVQGQKIEPPVPKQGAQEQKPDEPEQKRSRGLRR